MRWLDHNNLVSFNNNSKTKFLNKFNYNRLEPTHTLFYKFKIEKFSEIISLKKCRFHSRFVIVGGRKKGNRFLTHLIYKLVIKRLNFQFKFIVRCDKLRVS